MNISLNLLDNGLDFILEALKPVYSSSENNAWKYSVLNFFSGIELILKAKLKEEHWSLIFEDVSNANIQKLTQGDFISVSHADVIKRLKNINNLLINEEPLNVLRKLRNKFEHFEVQVSITECKEVIANALFAMIDFWDNYILPICNEEQNAKFNAIKSIINGFDAHINNIVQKNSLMINNIINNNAGILVHCQNCRNHSFLIYKDDSKDCYCFICSQKQSKKDYLNFIREEHDFISNGSRLEFAEEYKYDKKCPKCEQNTIIKYVVSYTEYYYHCIECFYKQTSEQINQINAEKNAKICLLEYRREFLLLGLNNTPEEFDSFLDEKLKQLYEELNTENQK